MNDNEDMTLDPVDTSIGYGLKDGEELLDFTQRVRLAVIANLTQFTISTDPKDVSALNSMLEGIDRQEINKAKIEIDSQSNRNDQETLDLIMGMATALGNTNPYESSTPLERTISHDGPVTTGVTLVPGELDNKPQALDYDTFMKDYKKANPRVKDD